MRAGVVAISVVAHAAVLGPLLYWAPRDDAVDAPQLQEISVVPPAPAPPPPPPPAPAARAEPVAPTRVRKPAVPRPQRVSTPVPAAGSGSGAPGSGSGSGSGATEGGSGTAPGGGDIDRSGPPRPVDPAAARTLPYTAEATRDRVSGDVVVSLEIGASGKVERATVKRGLGHGLDEIATKIALGLQFHPATDRGGNPVAGRVRWRFHFEPP